MKYLNCEQRILGQKFNFQNVIEKLILLWIEFTRKIYLVTSWALCTRKMFLEYSLISLNILWTVKTCLKCQDSFHLGQPPRCAESTHISQATTSKKHNAGYFISAFPNMWSLAHIKDLNAGQEKCLFWPDFGFF